MNLPPSARHVMAPQRLAAHLNSVLSRLYSCLQYIGHVKYANEAFQPLQQIILPQGDIFVEVMYFFPFQNS
jgi:hypothetical protein